jgi:hypothetical protein
LSLDAIQIFRGPVHNFVDIALFASSDAADRPDLAMLFNEHAAEVREPTRMLQTAADGEVRPWITAVGASTALVAAAHRWLAGTTETLGLLRTTFVTSERFGIGRNPATGSYRAHGCAFSLLIEPG